MDAKCVQASQERGLLDGVNALVGDQGDKKTLARWKGSVAGDWDVIIDDGGHRNKMIATSFNALWPRLTPGGVYFIEDIQLGRTLMYDDSNGTAVAADWLQMLAAQVVLGRERWGEDGCCV